MPFARAGQGPEERHPSGYRGVVNRRYTERALATSTRMLALRETRAHLDRLAAARRVGRRRRPDGADEFSRSS